MYTIPDSVRAISFDIWQTLIRGNSAFTWPRLQLVFGELDILHVGQEALTASYKKAERHLNRQAEITGYDTGMAERIEFILDDLGIKNVPVPDDNVIGKLQSLTGELRMAPSYRPELTEPDLLQNLWILHDNGYVLGSLSNTGMGDHRMMESVMAGFGFDRLFRVMLFSSIDGRAKPNPGLFRTMAYELGFAPHEVLHVGDNHHADCRAVEAGFHAVLYAPKGPPEGNTYPFITTMRELLG